MDILGIDLNLLVTLDVLLAERNVSRAARRLGRSQPAISAALARLRALLNDPLLVRRGSTMVPTPYAKTLQDPIRRILGEIEHALTKSGSFDPSHSTRTFRIATTDYTAFTLFPGLVSRIRAVAPEVRIELWHLDEHVGERLEAGALDLAVADDWALRHLRRRQRLCSERFVCLVRRDHPRIRRSLTLERFLAEKHALVSARGRVSGNVDDALKKLGRTRNVVLTLPHFLAVPAIIAETDLLVTLAERIARRFRRAGRAALAGAAARSRRVRGLDGVGSLDGGRCSARLVESPGCNSSLVARRRHAAGFGRAALVLVGRGHRAARCAIASSRPATRTTRRSGAPSEDPLSRARPRTPSSRRAAPAQARARAGGVMKSDTKSTPPWRR